MMDKVEKAVIDLDGRWPDESVGLSRKGYYLGQVGEPTLRKTTTTTTVHICTYPEFMEARKRLENKPTEWPDRAQILVYEPSDGAWVFGTFKSATPMTSSWMGHGDSSDCWIFGADRFGMCFGDWRRSLEPRPQFANTKHHDHKEGEGVKWGPGVDLPPEGTECLVTPAGHYIGEWYPCKVIAHYEGEAIFKPSGNFPLGPYPFMAYPPAHFKPIQSHRDRVIEEAMGRFKGLALISPANAIEKLGDMLKLPGEEE